MPPNLDQYLEEMLDTEVDLRTAFDTYSEGTDALQSLIQRAYPDHEATDSVDDKVMAQWEMRVVHMLSLAVSRGNEVESALMSYRGNFRRKLRELDLPAFLERTHSEEEEAFFGGAACCRTWLEEVNPYVAEAVPADASTPEELEELALDMEKVWK